MIGVDGKSEPNELLKLIAAGEVQWPCIRNWESDVIPSTDWGVSTWPANFLIDQKGVVQKVNVFDEPTLTASISELLRKHESK